MALWQKPSLTWVDFSNCKSIDPVSVWHVATRIWAAHGEVVFPSKAALLDACAAKKVTASITKKVLAVARGSAQKKLKLAIAGTDIEEIRDAETVARSFGTPLVELEAGTRRRTQLLLEAFQKREPALAAVMERWAGPHPKARWKRAIAKIKWLTLRHMEVMSRTNFILSLTMIGFQPQVATSMFEYMDVDHKGYVTKKDFTSLKSYGGLATVAEMDKFRRFVHRKFGSLPDAFRAFDKEGTGEFGLPQFEVAVEGAGWHENARGIFVCLDSMNRDGRIALPEFMSLDLFTSTYALGCVERLRDFLAMRFHNMRAAFRRIDKDGSGGLSFKEVCTQVLKLGFPGTQDDLSVCWRFLDRDCSGVISMSEFVWMEQLSAADFLTELRRLRDFLVAKFGSLREAFEMMDRKKSFAVGKAGKKEMRELKKQKADLNLPDCHLDLEEFTEGIQVTCGWRGKLDLQVLFNFLDDTHEGVLSLDEWMKLETFNQDASRPHIQELRKRLLEKFEDLDVAFSRLSAMVASANADTSDDAEDREGRNRLKRTTIHRYLLMDR